MKIHIPIILLFLLYACPTALLCLNEDQSLPGERISLEKVIFLAKERSIETKQARHAYLSAYWDYRIFRAQYLPSVNLSLTLPNFNRSLNTVQNYVTGEYNYVQSYSMRNSAQLSIDQNIAVTGARISLNSSLERMDQFGQQRLVSYINQPIALTISQPLWGTFNYLKWNRKIEPKQYEKAKKEYLESQQEITLQAVNCFFSLLLAQKKVEIAFSNYKNSQQQYEYAKERNRLRELSSNELAQIELSMRNDQLDLNQVLLEHGEALVEFNNFLRNPLDRSYILAEPTPLPDISLNAEWVYQTAMLQNSEKLKREIDQLSAAQAIEKAKQEKGISADLYIRVGYNKSAGRFPDSYRNLLDQETISLGIRIPLLDWGVGRGRMAVARSQAELTREQVAQEEVKYQQWVYLKTMEFGSQRERYQIAVSADSVASRLYIQANERFEQGLIDVLSLTNSQIEKDQAKVKALTELQNFWQLFYTLEKITLFDLQKQVSRLQELDRITNIK